MKIIEIYKKGKKYDIIYQKLLRVKIEIENEISSRPQYPNIGKKGCLKRVENILFEMKNI